MSDEDTFKQIKNPETQKAKGGSQQTQSSQIVDIAEILSKSGATRTEKSASIIIAATGYGTYSTNAFPILGSDNRVGSFGNSSVQMASILTEEVEWNESYRTSGTGLEVGQYAIDYDDGTVAYNAGSTGTVAMTYYAPSLAVSIINETLATTIQDAGGQELDIESNGAMPVNIQDQHTEAFVYYLHTLDEETALDGDHNIGDESVTVDSTVGSSVGDAITIFDGARVFQSIITAIPDGTTYDLASPLDFAYPADSTVEVGQWNGAVDGSVTPVAFRIHPPSGVEWDIYSIRTTILATASMAPDQFGSITGLTNGVIYRVTNGIHKNHSLVTNNNGYFEQGWDVDYDSRIFGTDSFRASKDVRTYNGVSLRFSAVNDTFEVIVRDNLTALDQYVNVIAGHVVTD